MYILTFNIPYNKPSQIAKFMEPTWDPPGSCRPQMGPMLAPWTLLAEIILINGTQSHKVRTNMSPQVSLL